MFGKKGFKHFSQLDSFDCGPTCLRMVSEYYGKSFSLKYLRDISFISKEGVSLFTISNAAERLGFKTLKLKLTADYLIENVPLPCILHWNNDHFIVLYKIKGSVLNKNRIKFYIADPGLGKLVLDYKTFVKCWELKTEPNKGFVLALEPTEDFYNESDKAPKRTTGFKFLYSYFRKHTKGFFQLGLGMILGIGLSFILPFLTQSMVDNGIGDKNVNFVFLILIFQLFVFFGNTTIDFIRSFLILHIGTNVNISLISDFLTKLMKLPIGFYDSKQTGDILHRIEDHKRIESFLTTSILDTLFSILNLIVLSVVLAIFGVKFLITFLVMSAVGFVWSLLFMSKIKIADYKMFSYFSKNTDNLYEIINGMPEIKLNNFQLYQRWKWEDNQLKLFSLSSYVNKLRQYQKIGTVFFNQLKNILITYFAVIAVINGQISFGVMLSISYIIGQLNSPIDQIISFFNMGQSAKIALERMNEIHIEANEENVSDIKVNAPDLSLISNDGYSDKYIELKNVSFQYEDEKSPFVLKDLNIKIPIGKITAIVGPSGSGKTTLLKVLLKFYKPTLGQILVTDTDLQDISSNEWREKCGVVMQEGYLFSDTIRRNIVMGDEADGDDARLIHACKVANILDFVLTLPLKFESKIGDAGITISTGQKQRVLIARAVYKNPSIMIFDEATSSLDATNEKLIVENLNEFYQNKTVIVIAHRLSTVKNADQIIVLENGEVKEIGHHGDLVSFKGNYYNLVKNQLELGN
ncbi:peptidase domain-containing ABC transporter [Mucilaginibacter sp. X5P1]|uniref:peptidase domain-containing ABC transporter n=1 Tax=Mucilaginibacter sp. X5P1 TaxID=2723088 RepID=UPI0016215D0D|nr:peptidase domain-containing ABC transporter [Mucilaginibacter sp. X5P1]MBB6139308.1 ATP-binding cassette subfamily B protein [Mucilaginibacter sp. X5P1]